MYISYSLPAAATTRATASYLHVGVNHRLPQHSRPRGPWRGACLRVQAQVHALQEAHPACQAHHAPGVGVERGEGVGGGRPAALIVAAVKWVVDERVRQASGRQKDGQVGGQADRQAEGWAGGRADGRAGRQAGGQAGLAGQQAVREAGG